MKLVKVFLGGQTVTLGKSSSEMGRVSMVVVTGGEKQQQGEVGETSEVSNKVSSPVTEG